MGAWLSALDGEFQPAVAKMTLAEFATAYAESRGPGLRRFKTPDPIIRKRHEDGTIELTNDVVLKPGKGGA